MIRKLNILFCENEHGTGDVTFPDLNGSDAAQKFVEGDGMKVSDLRREAKKAGWGRVNDGDFCPGCMESM